MDTLHVQNEIVREPNTAQEETAAYRTGNDLPGTSGYSNCPPHPPSYQQPPPYVSHVCTHTTHMMSPILHPRDNYYSPRDFEFASAESIKISNACGLYLGVLSIALVTASFLTFFYYVYFDTS